MLETCFFPKFAPKICVLIFKMEKNCNPPEYTIFNIFQKNRFSEFFEKSGLHFRKSDLFEKD